MSDWSLPLLLARQELKAAEVLLVSNREDDRALAAMHVEQAMVQLAKILAWVES